jgi:hypothetical protein
MTMFGKALSKRVRKPLLATFALTMILTPTYVFSAERDSTVLFFSFEDLKQELSKPDLSQLYPSFSWQSPQEQADQEGPIERNYRWGNGLGFDSYTFPGVRRPLWGY